MQRSLRLSEKAQLGVAPPPLRVYVAIFASKTGEEKRYSSPLKRGKIVRRVYQHLVLFAVLSLFAGLAMTASHPERSRAQTANKPNILFILLDDLRASDLKYMPNTQRLLLNQGVEF